MDFVKSGRWDVPKDLVDKYVHASFWANKYLDKNTDVPTGTDYERGQRWLLCSKQVMEVHRKICEVLNIEYTEDVDDEFYKAFHKYMYEQVRLRG